MAYAFIFCYQKVDYLLHSKSRNLSKILSITRLSSVIILAKPCISWRNLAFLGGNWASCRSLSSNQCLVLCPIDSLLFEERGRCFRLNRVGCRIVGTEKRLNERWWLSPFSLFPIGQWAKWLCKRSSRRGSLRDNCEKFFARCDVLLITPNFW